MDNIDRINSSDDLNERIRQSRIQPIGRIANLANDLISRNSTDQKSTPKAEDSFEDLLDADIAKLSGPENVEETKRIYREHKAARDATNAKKQHDPHQN